MNSGKSAADLTMILTVLWSAASSGPGCESGAVAFGGAQPLAKTATAAKRTDKNLVFILSLSKTSSEEKLLAA